MRGQSLPLISQIDIASIGRQDRNVPATKSSITTRERWCGSQPFNGLFPVYWNATKDGMGKGDAIRWSGKVRAKERDVQKTLEALPRRMRVIRARDDRIRHREGARRPQFDSQTINDPGPTTPSSPFISPRSSSSLFCKRLPLPEETLERPHAPW